MSVNLEYYRVFYYVALYGGIGRAARELCLTPPTITRTIQILESQVACQLFIRSVKGMHLTPEGQLLFARVKPSINLLMAGEQELAMLNSLDCGTVNIAMSEVAAKYFTMPVVFKNFCARYPKVHLSIRQMGSSDIRTSIESGDVDFAIMSITDGKDYGVKVQKIYDSVNVGVVGKSLRFLAERELTLRELSQYPLIFERKGASIRNDYESIYARHGVEFEPIIEATTLTMRMQAVELGLGYSFVPYLYAKERIDNGSVFMLNIVDEPPLVRPVCLLTGKDIPLSKAAQTLINMLLDTANEFTDENSCFPAAGFSAQADFDS